MSAPLLCLFSLASALGALPAPSLDIDAVEAAAAAAAAAAAGPTTRSSTVVHRVPEIEPASSVPTRCLTGNTPALPRVPVALLSNVREAVVVSEDDRDLNYRGGGR